MTLVDEFGIITRNAERRALFPTPPQQRQTMATKKPPSRDPRVQQVNPFLVKASGLYLRGYLDGTAIRRHLLLQVVAINTVVEALCVYVGEPQAIALSERRSRSLSWPRQAAMFVARIYCASSLPTIGRHFGHRDHTTVMHAEQVVICRLLSGDKGTEHAVASIIGIAGADPARFEIFMEKLG